MSGFDSCIANLRVCSFPCMEYVVKSRQVSSSESAQCLDASHIDVILLACFSSFFVCIAILNFYHSLHVKDRRTDSERQTLTADSTFVMVLFWSVLQVYVIRCNQEVMRGRVTLLTVMVFTLCCSHFLWKE